MKKVFIFLFVISSAVYGQQQQTWSTIAKGTSLPSTVARAGYMFFRTSDSLVFISTGVTWVAQSSSVGAGDITAVNTAAGSGLRGGVTTGAASLAANIGLAGAGKLKILSDSIRVGDESVREAQMLWASQHVDSIYSALPTKVKQIVFKISFLDTVIVGGSLMFANEPFAWTADSINASTNTGTATVFFDHRAHTTPRTRGTNIETGGLIADAYERSAAFDDATVPANAPTFMRVTATASSVKQLWVTVYARKD